MSVTFVWIASKNNWLPALDKNPAYFLPHTNTVILLELYCGTIIETGLPVLDILMETYKNKVSL